MNSISLVRDIASKEQTKGQLFVLDDSANIVFQCYTLELPWKNNERRISCIPEGRYKVRKRWSQRFRNHFHILDVPNRDHILIHHGNFVRDVLGCILVGERRLDIDGDGLKDVTNSVATMEKLLSFLPDETEIVVGSLRTPLIS